MSRELCAEALARRLARKKKELQVIEETMPNNRNSSKAIELEAIINELEFIVDMLGG
jgi:hypothetical protein